MTEALPVYLRHRIGDLAEGHEATASFVITREDVSAFSRVSGDHHPLHADAVFAKIRGYSEMVVHGALVVSRCSAFIAQEFVGSHGLLLSIASDFRRPIFCGQPLFWRGLAERINAAAGTVEIAWQVRAADGSILQRGKAAAWVPSA